MFELKGEQVKKDWWKAIGLKDVVEAQIAPKLETRSLYLEDRPATYGNNWTADHKDGVLLNLISLSHL